MSPSILALINLVSELYQRHFQNTGAVLTQAEVVQMLQDEIAAGRAKEVAWFLEHGLEPPASEGQ